MNKLYEGLSPSEKLDLWAQGKRPVKVKLCGAETLHNYFDSADYSVRYYCKHNDGNTAKLYIGIMEQIIDEVVNRANQGDWPWDGWHSLASMRLRHEDMLRLVNGQNTKQNIWAHANVALDSTYPNLNSFLQTLIGKITNGRLKVTGTSKQTYEKNGLHGYQYIFEIEPAIPGAVISDQTFGDFSDRMLLVQKAWAERIKAKLKITCEMKQNVIYMIVRPSAD